MNWKLLKAIKDRGMTQREFARRVKDSESVVSRAVTGTWNLDPARQRRYAETLGMTPEELFG